MTKSQTAALVANGIGVAVDVLMSVQQAQATLATAQSEAWTDDDPRWAAPFAAADGVLKAALDRLK